MHRQVLREFQMMTKDEVISAQNEWTKAVLTKDVEALLALYDFGTPEEPLLFKPTLADVIRLDEAGTRSYFVGGNPNYPYDAGFLHFNWKQVDIKAQLARS